MDEKEITSKEKVLAVYPDAYAMSAYPPVSWTIHRHDAVQAYTIGGPCPTEDEAWADAASKLPAVEDRSGQEPLCGPICPDHPATEGPVHPECAPHRRLAIHAAAHAAYESAKATCWAQAFHDEVLALLPEADRSNYGLYTPIKPLPAAGVELPPLEGCDRDSLRPALASMDNRCLVGELHNASEIRGLAAKYREYAAVEKMAKDCRERQLLTALRQLEEMRQQLSIAAGFHGEDLFPALTQEIAELRAENERLERNCNALLAKIGEKAKENYAK